MQQARLLIAGMKEYLSLFKEHKIGERTIDRVTKLMDKTMELKKKQAQLQAAAKAATAELKETTDQLGKEVRLGRNNVKTTVEIELWKAFGIHDKR